MLLNDPADLTYAQPLQGAVAGFKGKLKPITSLTSGKKLERALAQRWLVLMKAGADRAGGAGLVTSVYVGEHTFVVNGQRINADESIIGDTGIAISHLADFAALFSYFKNLKFLELDYPAKISFGVSYTKPSIPFTKSKLLQIIRFKDNAGRVIDYTRQHAAQDLNLPEDRLNKSYNTWSAMAAQVNKGSTSALCKPSNKLLMADWTKRLAVGAFGSETTWSRKRRVLGVGLMLLTLAGTIVTGGVQAARAARR
jgi:hypothetical protein